MVKRDWIKRYQELPPKSERVLTFQSWDTASKGGPGNDWSVCTTWIRTKQNRWYLIDVWRQRVDYPSLKAIVIALAKKFQAQRVLVKDTGAGIGLLQELGSKILGIVAVKPEGDKVARMAVASSKIEAGQVFLPERAPWLADLEAELFAFPAARYDDQCDLISQALQDKNVSWIGLVPQETWDRISAWASIPDSRYADRFGRCRYWR